MDLDEDLVILDIATDRYLCLPGAASVIQVGPEGAVVAPSPEAAADLVAAGLAQRGPAARRGPPPPAMPDQDLRYLQPPPLSVRARLRLLLCLGDVLLLYRGRSFAQVLAAAARPPRSVRAREDVPDLGAAARQAQQALIWLPISRKCLVRSFLVLRFLQRSGHQVRWVFGVRTWPFAAHCWLQAGATVLDDLPERLAAYRPICAV